MKSKILLMFIVLVGALVRFVDLGSVHRGMQPDETLYAYEGWSIQQTGTDHRQTGRPPLYLKGFSTVWDNRTSIVYPYIVAGLYNFLPVNLWTERLPAAAAGTLLIVVLYWIAREIWPDRKNVALLAAGFVAVSPTAVLWSRVGHDPILLSLFLGGMILSILRTRRHPAWWLAAAACLAVGLYGYQPFKLIGPVMFMVGVIWHWPIQRSEWKWLVGAVMVGLALGSPLIYISITHWSEVQSEASHMLLFNKVEGFAYMMSNAHWIVRYYLFGNIHFFIFLFPLWLLAVRSQSVFPQRSMTWLLVAWLIVALMPTLITAYDWNPTSMAPRGIGLVGCLELGAAAAVVWLFRRWRETGKLGRAAIIVVSSGLVLLGGLSWLTNAARSIAPRFVLGGMADGVAVLRQPSLADRQVTWHLALPWIPHQLLWYAAYPPRQLQSEHVEYGPWLDDESIELPVRFGRYRVCRVEECYQPHDGRLYVVPLTMLRDLPTIVEFTIQEGEHVREMPLHWKIVDNI